MSDIQTLFFRQLETLNTWLSDRLPARQDALFRTYLWVASLALTLNMVLLQKSPIWPVQLWQTLAVASSAIALGTICYCLTGLKGSADQDTCNPDWGAYLAGLKNQSWTEEEAFYLACEQMHEFIHHRSKIQTKRAHQLRRTATALMTCFILLFAAGALFLAT